jgi:tRNA threonylcarbamoyl adenosine modification protein YeaZ
LGSDALFLAFDTSAAHCAAAVVRGDAILAEAVVPMARGQAEALVPLLQRLMAEAGHDLPDLTALGVGIGPGNFTGTRIAVATARGLALALGRPAIGVSTFDLMRDPSGLGEDAAELVSVPAPREMAYVCQYRRGTARAAPRLVDPAAPPRDLRLPANIHVIGHRAAEIARAFDAGHREAALEDLPRRLGKVTEWKWRNRIDTGSRPAPLYVKPPDAAPPGDPPPVLLP